MATTPPAVDPASGPQAAESGVPSGVQGPQGMHKLGEGSTPDEQPEVGKEDPLWHLKNIATDQGSEGTPGQGKPEEAAPPPEPAPEPPPPGA